MLCVLKVEGMSVVVKVMLSLMSVMNSDEFQSEIHQCY